MTKRRPFLTATMMGGGLLDEHDLIDRLDGAPSNDASTSGARKRPKKQLTTKSKTYNKEEEQLLENILFGDRGDILSRIDGNVDLVSVDTGASFDDGADAENQFFIVDKAGDNNVQIDSDDERRDYYAQKRTTDDELDDLSDDELRTKLSDANEPEKKSAWEDEDDEIKAEKVFDQKKYPKRVKSDDNYKGYLENKFTSIFEPPSWATKALEKKDKKPAKGSISDSEDDSETDDEFDKFERTARDYKRKSKDSKLLDKDFLRVKKCTHLNNSSRVRTSLNCVNFHPNSTVALLGSHVGLVRLFQVDGKVNSIIQSIYFRGYRMSDAKFISLSGREEIIVGSDGSSPNSIGYCYYYDMIAGKIVRIKLQKGGHRRYCLRGFEISPNYQYLAACDQNGFINILSSSSKEHIAELKMNGDVDCLAFSKDSNYLLAHGKGNACQAYVWDIRNLRSSSSCVNRFTDLGTIEATSVALSNNLCAIGSNMGIVNLYNMDDIVKKSDPQPIRSVMNLTTAVTSLRFNHDDQLLMMASSQKDDAIRFVNTRNGNVYKNFPAYVGGANNKTYGRIYGIDISPHSGYASFVSGNGTANLFRINHYSDY